MARIAFTPHLRRHLECEDATVEGSSLREIFEVLFAERPQLRGYVVDEQGALRKHVVVFIDGRAALDRETLSDEVGKNSEVYVMQALSGG